MLDQFVYHIYPKSYKDSNGDGIGDLNGIIEKLDYIKGIGVDYIWLSPICKSPQNDNGYDISDYYSIDPIFGTNDDYFNFIAECEKRDMKVMMDLVLNHVSTSHEWFQKAISGDKKYYDYFIWRDEPNDIFNFFGDTSWTYVESVGKYYMHLFDPSQADLNWDNEEVRKDIFEMVNYWIENGVKGFRLDVIDLIGKEPDKLLIAKGENFLKYLKELQNNTFKNDILTVGECWLASVEEAKDMCSEDGLTQVFHFEYQCMDQEGEKFNFKAIDFNQVIVSIKKWQNEMDVIPTNVMNNHDLPRLISNWFDAKNHHYGAATLAAGLFHLLRGTSYIYQGEEIGMLNADFTDMSEIRDVESINYFDRSNHFDGIRRKGRDNARIVMQWNDAENAGFSEVTPWIGTGKSYKEINVQNDLNAEQSVYQFYQKMVQFKKDNQSLINARIEDITFDGSTVAYTKDGYAFIFNVTANHVAAEYDNVIFSNFVNEKGLEPYQFVIRTVCSKALKNGVI